MKGITELWNSGQKVSKINDLEPLKAVFLVV